MSLSIENIFGRIPQQDWDHAVNSGLLLGSAVAIFYLFFGRLFSVPELVGVILRKPISELSRNSLIVVSGFIFISALLRTLYHQHLTNFYPFDDQIYLKKISTLRLIISGVLVGFGSQYAITGSQNTGILGVPTLSLRSNISTLTVFATTMLTVTYQLHKFIPDTPRVLQLANKALPKNISFDAYLLVSLLVPFLCFLISSRKSLKGMVQSLLHFAVGIMVGCYLMLLGWSQIQIVFKQFRYSKSWTGDIFVAFTVGSLLFVFFFLIVKYGFKKPLFSNALQDKKAKITARLLFGCGLVGVGFGLGGLLFESFLLTVTSSGLRILIFWGLPCVFSMKAVQVMSDKSQLVPIEQKKA